MNEFCIVSSMYPIEILYYILTFDKRFYLSRGKLYLILPLPLSRGIFLSKKPKIESRIFDGVSYGNVVNFTNPCHKIFYTKIYNGELDEIQHRYTFQTCFYFSQSTISHVHFCL